MPPAAMVETQNVSCLAYRYIRDAKWAEMIWP